MENKKYSIKQGYVVREIAGEFIAVPVDSSCGTNIIILNPVSKLLWEELQKDVTLTELVDKVTSSFDVSREEAEKDTKEFLFELLQLGFFE